MAFGFDVDKDAYKIILYGPSGEALLPAAAALADATANPTTTLVGAANEVYNGTTWDRQRGNTEGTLLPSAARTSTTTSAVQTNYNARGILVALNVTAASGTGGLQVRIQMIDPVSANTVSLNLLHTAIVATGTSLYALYPGATGGNFAQATSELLPRTFVVAVAHGDGSSYTYSLGYSLIV